MVLALVLPGTAGGQVWQVDVSGTTARYDTGARIASAGIAPQLEWTGARSLGLVGGTIAAMGGSTWSAQGRADGWVFLPASRQSTHGAALSAGASGSVHSAGYRTAGTRAELRWMVGRAATGAWLGLTGSTGWVSTTGAGSSTAWGPTAGLWTRRRTSGGDWTGSLLLRTFRFEQSWFTEVGASLMLSEGGADVTGFAGWRRAPAASGFGTVGWGGAALAIQLAPNIAITFSGGSYPSDLLQALPRGRYLSAGIRVANRITRAQREPPPVYLPKRLGATNGQELRFTVTDATTVAIAGDWTGWAPVPLTRSGRNTWTLLLALQPGVYRFSLIADGNRWLVPAEVTAVDDGLGGKTGILVIP